MTSTLLEEQPSTPEDTDLTRQLEVDPAYALLTQNPLLDLREFIAKRTFIMHNVTLDDVETTGLVLPAETTPGQTDSFKVYSAEPRREFVTEIPSLPADTIIQEIGQFGKTGVSRLTRATISLGLGISTLSVTNDEENTLTLIFDTVTNPEGSLATIDKIRQLGQDPEIVKNTYLRVYDDDRGFTALVMNKEKFFAGSSYSSKDPIIYPKFQFTGLLGTKEHGAVQAGFSRLPLEDHDFLRDFFNRTSGLTGQLDVIADGLVERKIVTPAYIAAVADKLIDLVLQDVGNRADSLKLASDLLPQHRADGEALDMLAGTISSASDTQGQLVQFLRRIRNLSPVLQRVDLQREITFMGRLFESLYKGREWNIVVPETREAEYVTTIPAIVQVLLYYLVDHAIKTNESKSLSLGFHDDGDLAMINLVYSVDSTGSDIQEGVVQPDVILPADLLPLVRTLFRNVYIRVRENSTEISFAVPSAKANHILN